MGIVDEIQGGKIMGELKKQLPFAISKALNEVAIMVKEAERKEMEDVFENPTPYTLNSIYFKKATKHKLEAHIFIKNEASKGTPPVKYLEPQIFGGIRSAKSSEKQLREKRLMDDNQYWAPGSGARLNNYGNIAPGQIVQILSALKAFREVGYTANLNNRRMKSKNPLANNLFAQKKMGKALYPGIYKRTRTGVIPLLIFIENPNYKKQFNFYKIGSDVYDKNFEKKFNDAIQYALATSK